MYFFFFLTWLHLSLQRPKLQKKPALMLWWWSGLETWSWQMRRGAIITSLPPLANFSLQDMLNKVRRQMTSWWPLLLFCPHLFCNSSVLLFWGGFSSTLMGDEGLAMLLGLLAINGADYEIPVFKGGSLSSSFRMLFSSIETDAPSIIGTQMGLQCHWTIWLNGKLLLYIYKPEGNCTWHVRLAFYLLDELYLTATLQMYMRELYFLTIL